MSWQWSLAVALGAFLALYVCVHRFILFFSRRSFQDGPYIFGHHQWRSNDRAGPHWCNVCESVVYGIRSYVVSCDICGISAHARCALLYLRGGGLPQRCACKVAAIPMDCSISDLIEHQQHAWVKGNIDPLDTCDICGLFCGNILSLSAIQCAWCHRRVHETCFHTANVLSPTCDYGPHRRLILPPTAIRIQPKASTMMATKLALSSVKSAVKKMKFPSLQHRSSSLNSMAATTDDVPSTDSALSSMNNNARRRNTETNIKTQESSMNEDENGIDEEPNNFPYTIVPPAESTPLLVFINSRSGGQMGVYVLRQLRKWLNPLQVYDLSIQGPKTALLQFRHVTGLQILVCGGDGTIGWVLGTIDELVAQDILRQPPVAVLPLGTGNDLARVLGWGGGYSDQGISDILSEVEKAHTCLLDRWRVDLNGTKRSVLNNYFGVGVDAQVALEFHEQRERSPALFMSQFINKLWYSRFGAKNFITRTCAHLETKIELICDGERIVLPTGIEGVIIANINSYGGGSVLWHEDEDNEYTFPQPNGQRRYLGPSSQQDGLLDVVAVYGTLHLGQLQVGLSKAIRLCQCKQIELKLLERLPVQIDGEPWMQDSCTIDITFFHQAFMLGKTIEERDTVARQVAETLDWAGNNKIITWTQRDILLAEIVRRVKSNSTIRKKPSIEYSL
ncbi:diacylglycerol kinase [Thraustotheca clavata]|uniref:Diacylglycerol kinase n=1 Tax=Thraustotheca clavata TaxID=74557 RepID=A0A1V9ZXP2_9STRA|nr:diacylglycerol kinase [Thraustotheca clavata]